MASKPRWGMTDLPQIDAEGGVVVARQVFGVRERALSGALKADYMAGKHVIALRWSGLTAAERASLLAVVADYRLSPQTLTLPDGRSYAAVLAREDTLEDRLAYAGATALYDMALTFEES